ncbi:MAG: GNAT family N-acetyltransferase [Novosphingobium sp.]
MKVGSITASDEATPLEIVVSPAEWRSRLPGDSTPMQHYVWNEACLAALCRSHQAIVLAPPGGVAALVRKGIIPTLYLAGAEELAEPSEPTYADAAAARRMAQAILAHRLPVRLGQPLAQTDFATEFLDCARRSGLVITRPTEGSPFIDLDQSWVCALDRFSTRRRSDFRRMQRKAAEFGAVDVEFHEPAADAVSALLEQAIAIEAKGWKARNGTAIADNPDQLAFFRAYAPRAAALGTFRIAFLKLGNELAAVQIAAECDGSFWLFKIGYDERFARCSPGQLLMLESIQRAARKGLKRFEFLGKSAEWTRFWTEAERPRMRLLYYPWNGVGAAALLRDTISLGRKKFKNGLVGRKA